MSNRSLRISAAAVASGAVLIAASGIAVGAPAASTASSQAQATASADRASGAQSNSRGNGGNGNNGGRGNGGNGGNGGAGGSNGGGRPVPNPIITPPSAPATPVAPPVIVRPPTAPAPGPTTSPGGNGNSGGSPGNRPSNPSPGGNAGGSGGTGTRPISPAAGSGTGGASSGGDSGSRNGAPTTGGGSPTGAGSVAAPAVPRGLPTRGLSAGSGPVAVTLYMDLSDASDAATYLSVTTRLLSRVAADRSATVTFSPIIMGSDSNSMEAALAVLAGANQNKAWCVTAQVATLRSTRGGDWINRTALRSIARTCKLSSARFVGDATGNRLYPRLNAIRQQAQADGVGATPSYVVKGDSGSQTVANPGSADAIVAAISGES